MGKSIFKFYNVNDYSLAALSKNQIFCNHYSAFNDPFECWCLMLSGVPDPIKEKSRFAAAYRAWGFPDPDFSDSGIEQLNEYCEQFDNDYSVAITRYIESARIACFSRDITNLLMWSHYTDGLRGFCIEFDSDELLKLEKVFVLKVKYKRRPETFDSMVFSIAEDQVDFHEMVINEELQYRKQVKNHKHENIRPYADWLKRSRKLLYELYAKQLAVKPVEWSYEKEMRLIFHTENESSAGELFSYPEIAIKSVFFGEKMTALSRTALTDIIMEKYPELPIGIAVRDKLNYKINIRYDLQRRLPLIG